MLREIAALVRHARLERLAGDIVESRYWLARAMTMHACLRLHSESTRVLGYTVTETARRKRS